MRTKKLIPLITLLVVSAATTVSAQEEAPSPDTVQLVSPYLGVAVEPGETADFSIGVLGPEGAEATLSVTDLPDGWAARLRGGGYLVDRVLIGEEVDLTLEVDVPPDTADGTYRVVLEAESSGSQDSLVFDITVTPVAGGGVSLNAEFPTLRGPSDVRFSFTLDLSNDTGEEIQFGLQSQGPPGWQITARPAGETRAATVTVDAGRSERVTVEADPPDFTPAGTYPIVVQAAGGGESVTAELVVEITGNFAIALVTPDERLNVEVEAGRPTEMRLVVVNEGTAPLTDVNLTATPPRGWEVEYSPSTIEAIEPGATAEVVATVTPSGEAITGDYQITMRAAVAETSDSIEVRATVETSAVWGLVGLGVILAALVALAVVFRRFGRR